MLWHAAEVHGSKPAIIERDLTVTYAQLLGRASDMAAALTQRGVRPGDRVAIVLDRGVDAVAAYFGTLSTGAVVVMLNSLLRPRQIEYALEHSEASALLTSAEVTNRLHRPIATTASVLHASSVQEAPMGVPHAADDDDLAQITYTSGSTGMPKGVVATHANVWAAIATVAEYLGLDANDRITGLLPFSGVYGANQVLCSTYMAGTLVVPQSTLMNEVAAELRANSVTVLAAVPALWMQLLNAPGFSDQPISSLRILQNAGGHLAPAAVQRLRATQPGARLFLQYGMTEVFRSTYLPPEELDRRPNSMGRAMPHAEILVVAENGDLCAPGEVGELVHSGPTVTKGYWRDQTKTDEVYRPHPIRGHAVRAVYSGDLVRRDDEGFLYFVGRRDRIIKTLGYRVGPDEILDVLYASGEIVEGVVTAEDDSDRGQRIVAYVVLKPGGSAQRLTRFCRAELPRHMQPAEINALAALPKSPNGKHDLIALRSLVGTSPR